MTSRSCRLFVASLLAWLPGTGFTQSDAGASIPPRKHGYIRFWNAVGEGSDELNLVKQTPEGPQILATASALGFTGGYVPFAPGIFRLKVVSADGSASWKAPEVVLKPGTFVTVLAQTQDGAVVVEVIGDTYDRAKELTGTLTLRHFLPGAAITVTSARGRAVGSLEAGDVQTIAGLPLEPVLFRMSAVLANGETREWSTEVDFRQSPRASLLLAFDPYGRFRPRTSVDGQLDAEEEEAGSAPE